MNSQVQTAIDIGAVGVTLATISSLLPPIAAALTIVWTLLRIYEMKTVQKLIAKFRSIIRTK